MKYIVLLMVVIVSGVSVTVAQSKETCPGAQKWYDSLDTSKLVSITSVAFSTTETMSKKIKAINDITDFADKIESEKLPNCLAKPQKWYAAGIRYFAEAFTGVLGEIKVADLTQFSITLSHSEMLIGQFRGYMVSIGVTILDEDATKSLLLK